MEPMLSAISEAGIPKGDGWEYEPKWDGFRTLVFRDGDEVALMSRGGRPMTRYFPELLPAFRALPKKKLVLDGELVVVGANGIDFGARPSPLRQESDASLRRPHVIFQRGRAQRAERETKAAADRDPPGGMACQSWANARRAQQVVTRQGHRMGGGSAGAGV